MTQWPAPEALTINGENYPLLEVRPGQRKWDTREVPSQPGDGGREKPFPIELGFGFGASTRHTSARGEKWDQGHHAYAQNVDVSVNGIIAPSPRITYIDLSTLSVGSNGGFQFGGTARGQLGGGTSSLGPSGLGGGIGDGVVTCINEYRGLLYCSGLSRTHVVDPSESTPSLKETKQHSASANIYSQEVFDNTLIVALGPNEDTAYTQNAYSSSNATPWQTATGVKMQTFSLGGGGRLFSAKENRVYNVLAGVDPTLSASYLPSAGEAMTDETDEVRGLVEWARGVVAGTKFSLRTFDPEAGFISRALLPAVRASPSDYDGRAIITVGEVAFFATPRAVWYLVPGREPVHVGPELLEHNETPYIGGQPGVPAFDGENLWWPYYFPTSGDSVIFKVRPREQNEPGTGPFVWLDALWLDDRECRVAFYWGGTSSVKPRLFFGAGTTANPEQLGWAQLGRGGTPDIFDAASAPALSGTLYLADDDFGTPGVTKEVVRLELPDVKNATAANYVAVAVSDDGGSTYKNLVKTNTGAANDERVTTTGYEQLFADVATPSIPAGRKLQLRFTFTQESGATTHVQIRGTPMLYCYERPDTVEQVETYLSVSRRPYEDAETMAARLKALVAGAKVTLDNGPGQQDIYIKVVDCRTQEVAILNEHGMEVNRELAVALTFREVATA